MNRIWRALLVIVMVYALVMAVMTVQYFFDRGDLKKASKVIYSYQPPSFPDKTLIQVMANHFQITEDKVYCESSLISRYEGKVLVECGNAQGFVIKQSKVNFEWLVNVVAHSIVARNELAKKIVN
jgi:hypothetical protein